MDTLKTYKQLTAPPSIALSMMILRRDWPGFWDTPPSRDCTCDACPEYFKALDRISRGEQP